MYVIFFCKGHSLLKKKADALQMKFRTILKKIIDTKQTMGEIMKVGKSMIIRMLRIF